MSSVSEPALERAVKDLANAQAELEQCRLKVDRLTFVVDYLKAGKLSDGPDVEKPVSSQSKSETSFIGPESPLYGFNLTAAAIYALSKLGEPSTAAAIVQKMRDLGWPFNAAKNPATNVYWALRENSMKQKRAVSVPGSMWRLSEWAEESEVSVRTKEALIMARTRGTKLGPKPKLDHEMQQRLEELFSQGLSIAMAARELNITPQTIYRYKRRLVNPNPDLAEVARDVVSGTEPMGSDEGESVAAE